MSKIQKNYGWLNTRSNSAKTLLARAKREVPGFADHIRKFEEQITIKEQLGHSNIKTTMMYLHVAKVERKIAPSPFDRLYPAKP